MTKTGNTNANPTRAEKPDEQGYLRRHNLPKSLIAELIGTFFLVEAALLSPPGLTFALVGLTLLVMVIAIGKVSGAHLNPAVTAGLVAARLFHWRDGLLYVLIQVVGAFLALGLGQVVGRRLPEAAPGSQLNAVIFEMLGTALLVFVVTRVAISRVPEAASALAIGLALSVGIALAGASSGGVLNPAIALALLTGNLVSGSLGLGGVIYLLVPLLAGVGAALLARYLTPIEVPEQDRDEVTAAPSRP